MGNWLLTVDYTVYELSNEGRWCYFC